MGYPTKEYIEHLCNAERWKKERRIRELQREKHLPLMGDITQDTSRSMVFWMHFEVDRDVKNATLTASNGQQVYITHKPIFVGHSWQYTGIVITINPEEELDKDVIKEGALWEFPDVN